MSKYYSVYFNDPHVKVGYQDDDSPAATEATPADVVQPRAKTTRHRTPAIDVVVTNPGLAVNG
jgi:hypothetical protein